MSIIFMWVPYWRRRLTYASQRCDYINLHLVPGDIPVEWSRPTRCRTSMAWKARSSFHMPWWRHQMEAFSALLALCARNSPVTGEFPAQRPVTRSIDVFSREASDLRHPRAHHNVTVMCWVKFGCVTCIRDIIKEIALIYIWQRVVHRLETRCFSGNYGVRWQPWRLTVLWHCAKFVYNITIAMNPSGLKHLTSINTENTGNNIHAVDTLVLYQTGLAIAIGQYSILS